MIRTGGLTVTIEHVRHRVAWTGQWPLPNLALTRCGRRFLPRWEATRDTEWHRPARGRCEACA